MQAERVREAVRTGVVFEAVIAPVVKECAWGEIKRSDEVTAGSDKGVAEQYLMRYFGGVEEMWLIVHADDEYAEKALEKVRRAIRS